MIIETERDGTSVLSGTFETDDGETVEYRAEFGDERRARVPAETGEYLADAYPAVSIHTDERETETESED